MPPIWLIKQDTAGQEVWEIVFPRVIPIRYKKELKRLVTFLLQSIAGIVSEFEMNIPPIFFLMCFANALEDGPQE